MQIQKVGENPDRFVMYLVSDEPLTEGQILHRPSAPLGMKVGKQLSAKDFQDYGMKVPLGPFAYLFSSEVIQ